MADEAPKVAHSEAVKVAMTPEVAPPPVFGAEPAWRKAVSDSLRVQRDESRALMVASGQAHDRASFNAFAGENLSDGVDATGALVQTPEQVVRYDRITKVMDNIDPYLAGGSFDSLTHAKKVYLIKEAADKLLSSPVTRGDYAGMPNARAAAEETARQFYKSESMRARLESSVVGLDANSEAIRIEVTAEEQALARLRQEKADLQLQIDALKGAGGASGEIDTAKTKRREYDRFSDAAHTIPGTEFTAIQDAKTETRRLDGEISTQQELVKLHTTQVNNLNNQLRGAQTIEAKGSTATPSSANILTSITTKEGEIGDANANIGTFQGQRDAQQTIIESINADKAALDTEVAAKEAELKAADERLKEVDSAITTQEAKVNKLRRDKTKAEEAMVAQVEAVVGDAIEKEMIERITAAKEAGDAQLTKDAEHAESEQGRRLLISIKESYLDASGKPNATTINADYKLLLARATSVSIPPGPSFYLDEPGQLVNQMLIRANVSDADRRKLLSDDAFMEENKKRITQELLRQKAYASNKGLIWFRRSVKPISPDEARVLIQQDYMIKTMEDALSQRKGDLEAVDKMIGGGLIGGGGSLKEKISRMPAGSLALLLMLLVGGGAAAAFALGPGAAGAAGAVGAIGGGIIGAGVESKARS